TGEMLGSGYADGPPASPANGIRFVATRPTGSFDLVLLLDVLEHVAEDRPFVERLVTENLAPGAAVLVTVPAWPSLFGRHDALLRPVRRYRPAECARLLERAGLDVVERGGLFHAALFARAGTKFVEGFRRPDAAGPRPLEWRHGSLAARVAGGALSVDTR